MRERRRRSRVRRLLLQAAIFSIAATLYIASPFWAAWTLREAIKRGDAAEIESRVVWDSLRESLKVSLAKHTELLPQAEAAASALRPTLWQRVKSAFGATLLDRFVESYVTPEGLPRLFSYRRMWNEKVQGDPDPTDGLPWYSRFAHFYARVKRAEFQSFGRVEIEVEDRHAPERRYVSVFELRTLQWKLVGLSIATSDKRVAAAPVVQTGR